MSTNVPSTGNRAFWAAQTVLTFSGTNVQAAVGNINMKWGYKIHEEVVTGQSLPYLGTGVFHGEVDFETLGSSDSRWENMISTTSGIVPTFGMTWKESDTQSTVSGRTWTISGKFTEYEKRIQKDGPVLYRVKGILGTEPTVA